MEYTNNRPKEIVVAAKDPRCTAIATRYGTADTMLTAIMGREPAADTPETVLVIKTYGKEAVTRQLCTRMRIAMLRLDESALNDEEMMSVATAIADDPTARTLGYDLVMGFFASLERCEYELYACKPRNIMSAWQQYAKRAVAVQTRLKDEADRLLREQAEAKHQREYLRPEQFRQWKENYLKQLNNN